MTNPARYGHRVIHVAAKEYARAVIADLREAGRLPASCLGGDDRRASRLRCASMTRHVAVIPGDLAGQEVTPEAVKVVDALGLGYEFEEFEVGAAPLLRGGPAMSEQTFQEASGADAILFGAIGDPRVPDVGYAAQVLFKLRFGLDLHANP